MAYTDSFWVYSPDIELQYNGTSTVSTGWVEIDWDGVPSDVTLVGYELDFGYYEEQTNFTATVTVSNMDAYTRTKTVEADWNSLWLSTKPTHYKVDVAGVDDTASGTLILKFFSITEFYSYENRKPIISVLSQDKSKISSISGHDKCTAIFRSDERLQSWEARATLVGTETGHGVGILVEESTKALKAGVHQEIYIDDEELTNGDAEYIINVYGLSEHEGLWSDG